MRKHRRTDADIFGEDWKPKRGPGRPVADHRQQLVLAQAEGQRIKNAKMLGELVAIADVESAWAAIILELRAGMLAIPDRIGARLGDLTPAHVAAIDAEIRDVLASLGSADGGDDG